MLSLDDFLYLAGCVWLFSLVAYGVKKGFDYVFEEKKQK